MENPDGGGMLRIGNLVVTSCVTDSLLAKAYLTYEKEGTLPVIFYQSIPTISQFISAYMERGRRIVLGCFRSRQDESVEFCGMGWVNDAVTMDGYTKAETGIGMFRCAGRDNLAFGRMMFTQFFSGGHKIDSLFGTTPEPNKLALRYAQKLGMSLHGPIPCLVTWHGKPAPGWISHISRDEWMDRTR